jgi:antitoxin component HigA of HigAB toxin-antitoxin module
MMSVLDVSQKVASLPDQGESTTKQIASGTHLGRVDVGLRNHASSKQSSDLESVDSVVLRLASVNCLHVESVTENEIDAFAGTEVGEPVPGEDALRRDHEVLAERSDSLQEDIGSRRQVSVKQRRSLLVEHARVHASRVKIDAAVILVDDVVESHQALSFGG